MIKIRLLLFFLTICVAANVCAQDTHDKLPELSYTDYAFQQPVLKAEAIFYYADSSGVKPKATELYLFNKDQKIQ